MRIAIGSDEPYPVHAVLIDELERMGHEVVPFGAISLRKDAAPSEVPWALVAEQVALEVVSGRCDEAVLLCWTGTGISMAANKVPGIRAALCVDAATASGARIWNHANVLCLSNRLLSGDVAREILAAWFAPFDAERGREGVERLKELEARR